ncbi:CAP domain-containing protein [Nocardioides panacisoli]|uniref:CAP domain-containing protein n=1 Tax=Nocardioides panacisoli TaxID=627624 RepID=UPI001C62D3A7|nr:CAP domain-containing protein [Nocardioides panacisoli]QYJ03459.1 CAP domain-containing protein [Nocardioides panacisoli]
MRTLSGLLLVLALLVAGQHAPGDAVRDAAPRTTPATTTADLALTAGSSYRLRQERKVIAKTNAKRKQHGCRPLKEKWQLRRAARRHSKEMAQHNTLSHRLPGEPSLGKRVRQAGYTNWTMVGENVAVGYRWPGQVVNAWMNSSGHRANILNCKYRHIGVGRVVRNGRVWWTQDFGRR